MSLPCPPNALIARARDLLVRLPHTSLFGGLSFDIKPGLTLIQGGDGRGKTTLLQLLARARQPDQGQVEGPADSVFWIDPHSGGDDKVTLRQWLQGLSAHYPAWDHDRVAALAEALSLGDHMDKGLFMLSTGTRRKGALVAAMACGAQLTLLDTPFAALDARSRDIVAGLLDEAAGHDSRAFVVADFEVPPGMASERLAALVELGD